MKKKREKLNILETCKEPLMLRILIYLLWLLIIIIFCLENVFILSLIIIFSIYGFESWPDVTITEQGIILKTLFGERFIEWQQIRLVEKDFMRINVYVKGLPLLPRFVIIGWHRNYKDVLKVLRENAGSNST